ATAPRARHRNERLVGVVVVHHRSVTGFRAAVAEVKTFGNPDRGETRGFIADRRGDGAAFALWRLKSDDIVEGAKALLHLAVGKSAVGPFQVPEKGNALQHVGAGNAGPG